MTSVHNEHCIIHVQTRKYYEEMLKYYFTHSVSFSTRMHARLQNEETFQ
jgi:hypothetical protein